VKLNSYRAYACDTIIFILKQLKGTGFKERERRRRERAVTTRRGRWEYGNMNLRTEPVL
jgi:hypothetical protein